MKNKILNIIIVSLVLVWTSSCESDPTISKSVVPARKVLDVIQANGYTEFVKAVKFAGLEAEVNSATSQTIFAPNNNAFSVLYKNLGIDKVEQIDPTVLADIIKYHITTDGSFASTALPRKIVSKSNGKIAYLTQNSASLNAFGSIVLKDRSGVNGTFHGINLVLSPPTNSIYDAIAARAASASPQFTLLKYAIDRADLDETLKSGDFTLFAPTDAAFAAAGLGSTTLIDAMDLAVLKTALNFHVLPSAQFSIELVTGRVATANGAVAGAIKGADINATTPSYEAGTISQANQLATNGVWHQISSFAAPKIGLKEGTTTPGIHLFSSSNDNLGPDAFGLLVTASGYTRFNDINRATKDVVYFPRVPPTVASFASNEDIIKYIERHVFAPTVNFTTATNGTKVTSVGGNEYYIAEDATGGKYINGLAASRNAFGAASTSNRIAYDGTGFIWGTPGYAGLVPLPTNTIIQQLDTDPNFNLIAAAIRKAGKESLFGTGNRTFFAVDNAAFTAKTSLASVASIQALDGTVEADAAKIAEISKLIDKQTVNAVHFNIQLTSVVPILKNALNENVTFGIIATKLVVIDDIQRPDTKFTEFVTPDMLLAKNGVIHKVNKFFDFK